MLKYVNNVSIHIFTTTRNESTLVDDKNVFMDTVDHSSSSVFLSTNKLGS